MTSYAWTPTHYDIIPQSPGTINLESSLKCNYILYIETPVAPSVL